MRVKLAAAALLLATIAPAQGQPADLAIDQRLNAQIPLDLVFHDERGDAFALGKYFGTRPVVLMMGYYRCPRLCSLALNHLAESLRKTDYEIGRDFEVIMVSIDPRETPELAAAKKAALAEHYGRSGADTGWHLLTGEAAASQRLADAVGFRYAFDAERDLYAHAAGIIVLTPDGKVARYLFGLEYSPRDLGFALEDASAGTIGSPVEQPLRLLCFAYDPVAGKYTLMTMRLVQIGGALTVVLLGCYLVRAWRRNWLGSTARKTPSAG